eukprot:1488778-Rhodomonas_salina.3
MFSTLPTAALAPLAAPASARNMDVSAHICQRGLWVSLMKMPVPVNFGFGVTRSPPRKGSGRNSPFCSPHRWQPTWHPTAFGSNRTRLKLSAAPVAAC